MGAAAGTGAEEAARRAEEAARRAEEEARSREAAARVEAEQLQAETRAETARVRRKNRERMFWLSLAGGLAAVAAVVCLWLARSARMEAAVAQAATEDAAKKATHAREMEDKAKAASERAEQNAQEARRSSLAQAITEASRAGDAIYALPPLTDALRRDPTSGAAITRLVSLLTQHSFAVPASVEARFSDAAGGEQVNRATVSDDGNWLIVGGMRGTLKAYDLRDLSKAAVELETTGKNTGQAKPEETVPPAITSIAIQRQSELVAAASADGKIKVWSLRSGELCFPKPIVAGADEDDPASVVFSQDGASVIVGGTQGTVKRLDATSGELRANATRTQYNIRGIVLSHNGTRVLVYGGSPGSGGFIEVLNADTLEKVTDIDMGDSARFLLSAEFVPSDAYVLTVSRLGAGSDENKVALWGAKTGDAHTTGGEMPGVSKWGGMSPKPMRW